MSNWFFACLAICLTVAALVAWPLLAHPTLSRRKKLVFALAIFLLLVPGALALYGWVGVPLMAVL